MKKIQIQKIFVNTVNVSRFDQMMAGLELGAGKGRMAMVWGRAGRGKTRTSQRRAALDGGVYLRMLKVWRTSELDFLRCLCKELGATNIPGRKATCFDIAVDTLITRPRPIFIDEIEKLPEFFLEVVRDLTDLSCAPVILIGEEPIVSVMKKNRRVWSRVTHDIEFGPAGIRDIMAYGKDATGLVIPAEVAGMLEHASGGDWRLIERAMTTIVQQLNAAETHEVTPQIAQAAIQAGLVGR